MTENGKKTVTLPTQKTKPVAALSDLTVLIYGPSKIGKSTFCSKAEGALFLATEPGLNSLEVFQIPITTWPEFLSACGDIAKGGHAFKTIVIDTVDNMYRLVSEHITGKKQVEHESDLAYGKGWALVNNEFHRALTKLAHLPYGLYLISHSTEKEIDTRTGKVMRTMPTLPGKAREIVIGLVDIIAFCDVETSQDETKKPIYRRIIRTKPTPFYEAGDRTGKLPETLSLDYQEFLSAFQTEEPKKARAK